MPQDLYFYQNAQATDELWSGLQVLKGVSEGAMQRYALPRSEPLKAELLAFVTAIIEGQPMPVSGADGLAALRLALALVESGMSHQVVEVVA